jgi:arsenate reductase-like glutaredoxin family protein
MNLDDNGKIEWLCKENMLIKRPVVEFKSNLLIGFNEDNYKGVFL